MSSLSAVRHKVLVAGLTAMARKVYDAVPAAESWSAEQVHAELVRTTSHRDRHHTAGCLKSLVQSGLVQEHPAQQYRRIHIRTQQAPEENPAMPEPIKTTSSQPATIDRMGALAGRVRAAAQAMAQAAAVLETAANDIEEIALEIEDSASATSKDLAALAQLRTLLGTLGGPRQ